MTHSLHSMSNDSQHLNQIYKEVLMEHQKDPRNWGRLDAANAAKTTFSREGFNPLCGDRVVIDVRLSGGVIEDIRFQGEGCSICMASASIMTEEVRGKRAQDALACVQCFRDLLAGKRPQCEAEGDVEALMGVRQLPVRIKCALLPWTTFKDVVESAVEGPAPGDLS